MHRFDIAGWLRQRRSWLAQSAAARQIGRAAGWTRRTVVWALRTGVAILAFLFGSERRDRVAGWFHRRYTSLRSLMRRPMIIQIHDVPESWSMDVRVYVFGGTRRRRQKLLRFLSLDVYPNWMMPVRTIGDSALYLHNQVADLSLFVGSKGKPNARTIESGLQTFIRPTDTLAVVGGYE